MRVTKSRIVLWSLACLVLASACGGAETASRIGTPHGDLNTGSRAIGVSDGKDHVLIGQASWYGKDFHGRQTASGDLYDMYGFTAAHRTLPMHTIVRVVDPDTQKSVVVRVNDRGPYVDGRVIDLSFAAAHDLDMVMRGVIDVEIEILQWGTKKRPSR